MSAQLALTPAVLRRWSRKYEPHVIAEVLNAYEAGEPERKIRSRHGIGHNTLYRWVRQAKEHQPPPDALALEAENLRLRQLVVELATENKRLHEQEMVR